MTHDQSSMMSHKLQHQQSDLNFDMIWSSILQVIVYPQLHLSNPGSQVLTSIVVCQM
jgi:hypothetical protein